MKTTVTASKHDAQRWILELRGPLTAAADNPLWDAHGEATRAGASWVALDFRQVERMDGNGLSLLLRLLIRTRQDHQRLAAYGLTPRCRQLLRELGLDASLSLFSGASEALGQAAAPPPETDRAEICPPQEWACGLGRAKIDGLESPLSAHNVAGRPVATPLQGFGELWHKIYRLRLAGVPTPPERVVTHCKTHMGELWPDGNELHLTADGLAPGAVAHIRLTLPGGMPLSTGVRVLHNGTAAFTFITLVGHLEAGWITFSAAQEQGSPVMQVESLARTGDPMFELGFKLFGHSQQEAFWKTTLARLAAHYQVAPQIQVSRACLDPGRHWEGIRNLPHNAGLRTGAAIGASLLARLRGPRRASR